MSRSEKKKKKKKRRLSDANAGGEGKGSPPTVENEVEGGLEKKKRKRDKKKERKKDKKRRRENRDEEDTGDKGKGPSKDDRSTEAAEVERKKDRKKKKEKKEKKWKKDGDGNGDGDGDDEIWPGSSSRKKKRKRVMGGDKVEEDDDIKSVVGGRVVASSAADYLPCPVKAKAVTDGTADAEDDVDIGGVTLLLFYQYVEPPWDKVMFQKALTYVEQSGKEHGLTGRMRVAHEGLNCTLTGTYRGVRNWCRDLRKFGERDPLEFSDTEFKLTDHLPRGQLFPKLHAFKVDELVNYGLAGENAPPIGKTGVHLEPDDYHKKIAETDTVIIDVRNHYEANIGQFVPPTGGAEYVDPNMRKSTEFPVWLDKPETKEKLRGKQVLMYCTGGVRCERASALLRQKMESEEDTKELGIKGVYQLQGGIDKYFKEFPEGGWWKGKNYVFDKRFAHAPPAVEGKERAAKMGGAADSPVVADGGDDGDPRAASGGKAQAERKGSEDLPPVMGECEACHKPWDMYRGKRRCPTCGVPSLICRECFEADASKKKKLGRDVRCDLCVRENITSKSQVREREQREMEEYERRMQERKRKAAAEGSSSVEDDGDKAKQRNGGKPHLDEHHDESAGTAHTPDNPCGITRLFLKNMCIRSMDEDTLLSYFPAITHILWITDRKTGKWYGSAFVEMATPGDAASAVAMDGTKVLGRPIRIKYEKADSKDEWPPRRCRVGSSASNW